jgi:hypothetical protein
MYSNQMVAAIKANGRILREFKDIVYVPYNTEYSILIKNLHTQRALVNVFIDGTNIVDGGLVVNAGQEIDLERSIKDGNLSAGNKLKFIERIKAIEDGPRGIKLEDGIVKLEFQYEVPRPIININDSLWRNNIVGGISDDWIKYSGYRASTGGDSFYATTNAGVTGSTGDRFSVTASGSVSQMNVGGVLRGVDYSKGESMKATAASATTATLNSLNISSTSAHDGMATMDSFNDVGITVPGSRSDQKFQTTTMNALEPTKHTIVLKLLGDDGSTRVTEAVTVKHKPECPSCGKLNRAKSKFCVECGTGLKLFS